MKLTERSARMLEKMFNIILDPRLDNDGEKLSAVSQIARICKDAEIHNFEGLIRTFAPAVGGHRQGSYESAIQDLMNAMRRQGAQGQQTRGWARTYYSTGTTGGWSADEVRFDESDEAPIMPEWTKYAGQPIVQIASSDPDYLRAVGRESMQPGGPQQNYRFARLADQALKSFQKPGL